MAMLVGNWKLDETSGTTLVDSSASGNSLALSGVYTLNQSPCPNITFTNPASILFAAAAGTRTSGITAVPAVGSPVSVSFWVKFSSVSADQTIFYLYDGTTGFQFGLKFGLLGVTAVGGSVLVQWATPPVTGTWYNCVYTFDGTTHTFYVAGSSVATSTTTLTGGAIVNMGMGGFGSGGSEPVIGNLDDGRLYSGALTSGEVSTLAAGGAVPPLGLGAWLDIDSRSDLVRTMAAISYARATSYPRPQVQEWTVPPIVTRRPWYEDPPDTRLPRTRQQLRPDAVRSFRDAFNPPWTGIPKVVTRPWLDMESRPDLVHTAAAAAYARTTSYPREGAQLWVAPPSVRLLSALYEDAVPFHPARSQDVIADDFASSVPPATIPVQSAAAWAVGPLSPPLSIATRSGSVANEPWWQRVAGGAIGTWLDAVQPSGVAAPPAPKAPPQRGDSDPWWRAPLSSIGRWFEGVNTRPSALSVAPVSAPAQPWNIQPLAAPRSYVDDQRVVAVVPAVGRSGNEPWWQRFASGAIGGWSDLVQSSGVKAPPAPRGPAQRGDNDPWWRSSAALLGRLVDDQVLRPIALSQPDMTDPGGASPLVTTFTARPWADLFDMKTARATLSVSGRNLQDPLGPKAMLGTAPWIADIGPQVPRRQATPVVTEPWPARATASPVASAGGLLIGLMKSGATRVAIVASDLWGFSPMGASAGDSSGGGWGGDWGSDWGGGFDPPTFTPAPWHDLSSQTQPAQAVQRAQEAFSLPALPVAAHPLTLPDTQLRPPVNGNARVGAEPWTPKATVRPWHESSDPARVVAPPAARAQEATTPRALGPLASWLAELPDRVHRVLPVPTLFELFTGRPAAPAPLATWGDLAQPTPAPVIRPVRAGETLTLAAALLAWFETSVPGQSRAATPPAATSDWAMKPPTATPASFESGQQRVSTANPIIPRAQEAAPLGAARRWLDLVGAPWLPRSVSGRTSGDEGVRGSATKSSAPWAVDRVGRPLQQRASVVPADSVTPKPNTSRGPIDDPILLLPKSFTSRPLGETIGPPRAKPLPSWGGDDYQYRPFFTSRWVSWMSSDGEYLASGGSPRFLRLVMRIGQRAVSLLHGGVKHAGAYAGPTSSPGKIVMGPGQHATSKSEPEE